MNGKGSIQRPVKDWVKFRKEYDRIFPRGKSHHNETTR